MSMSDDQAKACIGKLYKDCTQPPVDGLVYRCIAFCPDFNGGIKKPCIPILQFRNNLNPDAPVIRGLDYVEANMEETVWPPVAKDGEKPQAKVTH